MARLLVNPRSRVFFGAFESDTYTLGLRGWNISVQENFEFHRFDMLMEHEGFNLILHAMSKDDPMREHYNRVGGTHMNARQTYEATYLGGGKYADDGPVFHVLKALPRNPNLKIYHEVPVFNFWSETRPAMIEVDAQQYNLMEFPIFCKKGEPAPKELIVEPQDVMQLLEQIKRMQAPEQATIRERRRRDTPVAHATILSFGEAA